MIKSTGMILLLIALFYLSSCQKDTSPITNIDTPDWLNSYIEEIQDEPSYIGTKVYRYEWKGSLVYHIEIPVSSCAYCEVYDQSGMKIEFKDDLMFQDFMNNKKNEVLVWEWKENN